MPMIQPQTVKAVQELLEEHGVEHRQDEPWGDYIARGFGVSGAKAETFLEALHHGCSVEQAKRKAGIREGARMVEFARTVGTAVGRIRRQIVPIRKRAAVHNGRTHTTSIGATEDQVNMSLQSPQRIDSHGTKPEDLAGTGEHDSQGG